MIIHPNAVEILKFWHSIEFFVPFDLDEVRGRRNAQYVLTEDQLLERGNLSLPWASNVALEKAGGSSFKQYRYNLYLLPFNKNELTKMSMQIFPTNLDEIKKIELDERLSDEGETCFARLSLDSKGVPDFEKSSVSTLPWALGKLSQRYLGDLHCKKYEAEKSKLSTELNILSQHLENPESTIITDHVLPGTLTARGVGALLTIFKRWAHFSPDHVLSLVVEIIELPPKKEGFLENKPLENAPAVSGSSQEKTEKALPDLLDILNSFYIEDLEKIINNIASKPHSILTAYLSAMEEHKKRDVYMSEHAKWMQDKLNVSYMNHARWPQADTQAMSLMQQMAINECFYPTNEHGLFSVNGPPGTGKTTLLQDIVAENITRRARILSTFKTTAETFKGKRLITFNNQLSREINLLDERLIGYEMVVVSSNNAAVENISKELPLKLKIAEKYRDSCSYLSAVAAKVSAEHTSTAVCPLKMSEKPWGIISVALGNSKNRNQFFERAFFSPEGKEKATDRVKVGEYLTIWEWRKQYNGPSFLQAKQDFIATDNELIDYMKKINYFSELHEKVRLYRDKNMDELLGKIKQDKADVHVSMCQHVQFKPNFLHRLFRTEKAKIYQTQADKLHAEWRQLLGQEKLLKEKIQLQKEYAELKEMLVGLVLPPEDYNFDKDNVQLSAFWQNEKLNELRSTLFISALKLQEAWLAEVLLNGLFVHNLYAISYMLSNKRPVIEADELYIWQSFFMWIPVVSSTFASVGRQFKNLGHASLGWVFIDEAGQAIPQAAVGALWRAKNAIVVGDPLQIEPVFTIPPNLIEGLSYHHFRQIYEQWLPNFVSVQTLADQANRVGAYVEIDSKRQWIGCPLRVHRRCLNPMFDVSNQIAYQNKMIYARAHQAAIQSPALGESCWYHVEGATSDKQYVQAQGEWILRMFAILYEQQESLPKVYIITPFKRIKLNLQKLLSNTENWTPFLPQPCKLPPQASLKKWCAVHIGTVHTFQGKESATVIIVLGGDKQNQGAANWASSKPNLLNVALTRAQDHIYIVGDFDLWSRKRYFRELSQKLKMINVAECIA